MSASEHLQPYQMKLFMQAKELMNIKAGDTDSRGEYTPMINSPHVHATKLRESKTGSAPSTLFNTKKGKWDRVPTESLYDSIKRKGVTTPVSIRLSPGDNGYEEQINDGGHRVASAHDINPEMYIPVEYK